MARLYITPTDFIEVSNKTSLLEEVATLERSGDWFSGLLDWLPNPDPVLRKLGRSQDVFDDLLSDPEVYGAVRARRSGVQKLKWDINGEKSDAKTTKFVEEMIGRLDVRRIIGEVLEGMLRGYHPMEIILENIDGYDLPIDVIGKPGRWFRFGTDKKLRFLSREHPQGEPVHDLKFVTARQNASYDNPYGEADLSRVYWAVFIMRTDTKSLLRFVEKHAMPWVLASYPSGTKQSVIDELQDRLDDMVQDAVGVFPSIAKVELTHGGEKATSDIYEALYNRCKAQVNKVLLGHASATDSTSGKLGNEDMAGAVRADIIEDGKAMVESVMNELIGKMVRHNLGERPLPLFRLYEEKDVDKATAERDAILVKDMGVEFNEEYIETTYKIDRKYFTMKEVTPPPPPLPPSNPNAAEPAANDEKTSEDGEKSGKLEFAESAAAPDQQSIDALLAILTPEQLSTQVDEMVGVVIKAVQDAEDYSEALEQIKKIYPRMTSDDLRSTLQKSLLLSSIVGRVSADGD